MGNDGVIKLADFGASKHWRSPVTTTVVVQTDVDAISRDRAGRERQSDIRGTPQVLFLSCYIRALLIYTIVDGTRGCTWRRVGHGRSELEKGGYMVSGMHRH